MKSGLCVFLSGLLVLLAESVEPPCSTPKSIEHGITDWDGKSNQANFACYQGYHLVGPPSVECRYGSWYSGAPTTYPTCKPIVCNMPVIQNGHLETGDNVRYRSGTQTSIECDDGFELRNGHHAAIICKEDGSWQPVNQKEFPICKEKSCQYPDNSIPVIENGSLEINGNRQGPNSGYKPGSVAVYHCHPGYVLLPFSAGKLVCHRGSWEGSIPACVSPQSKPVPRRSHCSSPPKIPNGYYITDTDSDTPLALPKLSERGQYERGTIARYHCQEGYIIRTYQGQDTYRCLANGVWSPKVPPVCIKLEQNHFQDPLDEIMCPSPSPIPNTDFERMEGWLTSNGAIHGTVLEYSCSIGYRDSRTPCLPTRRTCHAGKWVGNMPACVAFDFCERPPSISHGFMVTSPENNYRIWTEIYYECHPGYQMRGSKSLKCHPTGCWSPNDLPQCIREDLIDNNWSADTGSLPLVISLVTVSTGLAVIALFTTSCLVVLCRRKGGAVPHPPGPAHWSTTVTVTPDCRTANNPSRNNTVNDAMLRRHEQDRMALIAFADGMQQVTLPSYEEALRDNNNVNINHTGNGGCGMNGQTAAIETSSAQQATLSAETIITELADQVPVTRSSGGSSSSHIHYNNSNINYRRYQQNRSRSRHQRHQNRDPLEVDTNLSQWTRPQPHPRSTRRTTGASSSLSSGGSPRENNHDALSDTVSHHSVSSTGVNWSGQRQASSSIRSGSAASVEVGNGTHVILSKEPSESTLTTTDNAGSNGGNSSQTPSCRALAGSLASFDTSSIVNTEGVPLLEENETEGSNSSEQGDTGSATYSETSNKT